MLPACPLGSLKLILCPAMGPSALDSSTDPPISSSVWTRHVQLCQTELLCLLLLPTSGSSELANAPRMQVQDAECGLLVLSKVVCFKHGGGDLWSTS